ncbi:MAG: hypothetical protein NT011_07905 [Kiritimatiellaeota bacterium]|nr:hypothetical protein [Kiritimatiellota bacterium]
MTAKQHKGMTPFEAADEVARTACYALGTIIIYYHTFYPALRYYKNRLRRRNVTRPKRK